MKVATPQTDQSADFVLLVNDKPCPEYVIPAAPTRPDADNNAECFVAVTPGDNIAIKGNWSGSVLQGTLDLYIDGSWIAESRIDGKQVTFKQKKFVFERVLNCPYPEGWTSIQAPIGMTEGTIHVAKLEEDVLRCYKKWETPVELESRGGIGCISLVVSINQNSDEAYQDKARWIDIDSKDIVGGWRREPIQAAREKRKGGYRPLPVRDSGIQPDCQIHFQEEQQISGKRSSKHRRQWEAARPGMKPWCTFRFYYRTKENLDEAGCVLREDEVQQLAKSGEFVQGVVRGNKRRADESIARSPGDPHGSTGDADLTVPRSKKQKGMATSEPSDVTALVKPRLGGVLRLDRKGTSMSSGFNEEGVSGSSSLKEMMEQYKSKADREDEEEMKRYKFVSGSGSAPKKVDDELVMPSMATRTGELNAKEEHCEQAAKEDSPRTWAQS